MAASVGNKTFDITTPVIATRTIAHNSNGNWLFVETMIDSTASYVGVTYNGVAMTKIGEQTTTTTTERWAFWQLENPASGSNNVVVTMNAAPYNPLSINIFSGVSCGGSGNVVFDDTAASPNSTSITVSNGSIIYGGAVAGSNSGKVITLDGSSRTLEFTHSVYNFHYGAFSATGLTSGSKTVSVESSATLAGYYLSLIHI